MIENGLLVSGSFDGTVKVWDLERNESVKTLIGHFSSVSALVSLNEGYLASASFDITIRIWNT